MLSLSACASGPQLDKFERREIDRPYTLPQGVAAWHIPTYSFLSTSANSGSRFLGPIPFPLVWEQSLGDDWNILWAPIPLLVSHQISNTAGARSGIALFPGFVYSELSGWVLIPSVFFAQRLRLTKEFAWDFNPRVDLRIPLTNGIPLGFTVALESGPLFQVTERFAFGPYVAGRFDQSTYFWKETSEGVTTSGWEVSRGAGLDAGLSATWNFARQWDFKARYDVYRVAKPYRSHQLLLDLIYYW